ncbi:hypothetical protein GCM10010912_33640 [Paenibacillus albidus]|uniref:HD-GYP domain-containing protein n=1 Tax=Paenibacillus albidus TaxID=2041023 RepID=A0A917CDN3_9BACL|nr:hypothetical protein GCM10010912_33640 [Paenibacillus albidus]
MIAEHILLRISYSGRYKNELIMSAILHDIGKSLIPSFILKKRGALSLTEEKEYESHSDKGAEVVLNITGNKKIADWIKYHHERYDGKGFPVGLKGKEIPFESRIISLCNQLDHLMLKYSRDEHVLNMLQEYAGKILDPRLVSYLEPADIRLLRSRLVYNEETEEQQPEEEESYSENEAFIGKTILVKYPAAGYLNDMPPQDVAEDITRLADRALCTEHSFHEVVKGAGTTYEAHFYPEQGLVTIVMTDITPAILYRETMHRNILRSYKDVIETLSNSKVDICLTKEELEERLGNYIDSMQVQTKADVSVSRAFVADYYADREDSKRLMHIKLAVSEGVTNLIKHAVLGKVSLYDKNGTLQVYISDKGSGIALHELPKTILVSGYSSKRSMGKGFALIHATADHVSLHTNTKGTSLLIEFHPGFNVRKEGKPL